MKKWIVLLASAFAFMLVWAAGHDILKGEEDVWMEYAVVLIGLLLALSGLVLMFKKKRKV